MQEEKRCQISPTVKNALRKHIPITYDTNEQMGCFVPALDFAQAREIKNGTVQW